MGNGNGDSCSEPWLGGLSNTWTATVASTTLTLTSIGFDADHYACTGTWTGADFACDLSWTRAGRACHNTAHLEVVSSGLTFWLGDVTTASASCTK